MNQRSSVSWESKLITGKLRAGKEQGGCPQPGGLEGFPEEAAFGDREACSKSRPMEAAGRVVRALPTFSAEAPS